MSQPPFKQPNPRMQLVALLSGIEGLLSNIEDGSRGSWSTARKGQALCQQAQEILKTMPDGEWKQTYPCCPHCGGEVGIVNGGEGYWYPRRDCITCGLDTTKPEPNIFPTTEPKKEAVNG